MEFKVGDRVKHKSYGKGTVVEINAGTHEDAILVQFDNPGIELHNGNGGSKKRYKGKKCWYFEKETSLLRKISDIQFTKNDLKDGDIVIYRNGLKRTVKNKALTNEEGCVINGLAFYKDNLEHEKIHDYDIVEVKRSTAYETVFKKNDILDDIERRYLKGVIRPFKDCIEYIKKIENSRGKYICIRLKEETLNFPYLRDDTMYKNMETDKKYTLEELGL